MKEKMKRISLDVDNKLHKRLKILAMEHNLSLRDYLLKAIELIMSREVELENIE